MRSLETLLVLFAVQRRGFHSWRVWLLFMSLSRHVAIKKRRNLCLHPPLLLHHMLGPENTKNKKNKILKSKITSLPRTYIIMSTR
jgi:hypothetical protein